MVKMKYLIIFLTLLTISSCKNKESCFGTLSEDYLNSIPTPNGYYVDVIIPLGNDEIVISNATSLLYVYNQNYKSEYESELRFLKDLYAMKTKSMRQYFKGFGVEKIDPEIIESYRKEGLEHIIKSYLINYKEGSNTFYTFKNTINYTVCFIMFCNNYYLYYDDQLPNYIFQLEVDDLSIPF